LNLDCNNNALDRAWLTPFGAMEILATPLAKNKAKKGATEIGRLSGSNKLGRVGRLVD